MALSQTQEPNFDLLTVFQGGQVDETMISAYKAAKAAGISSFDAYIYPCRFSSPSSPVTHDHPNSNLEQTHPVKPLLLLDPSHVP